MLTFRGKGTMRFSWLVVLFVIVALLSLEAQQHPAPKSEPAKTEPAPTQEQAAKPADSGPAVDAAKVTGTTFESNYFKFTYETSCAGGAPLSMKMGSQRRDQQRRGQSLWYKIGRA